MRCPYCDYQDSKVIDSRSTATGIRRRRQCLHCSTRFTTYEQVHSDTFLVVKKDGRREEFSRDKLTLGIRKACVKRPIASESIEHLVEQIEEELQQQNKVEVSSQVIGEMVMERLRLLDRVAYIRFASVYRDFADIETFKEEVDALIQGHEEAPTSVQLPMMPTGNMRGLSHG